ncbi:putative Heat shock protein DnaJ,  Molecular chaperone, Hsp40, DnaJ, Sec63 domain protein [Trachipleistophora hominis]|uniref:Putative Heat shock protein DnaJ, Molecular chaperone, Hsp40, DnaJ, Sec63 domain protein n=1 Tax=Trachipleistophora hominis TaxID=72359 RepID=L7JZ50_TRAHO|nr:putative Heat shock protein DnaJ,  Molecular chaperone, Hsp40, DnaJ, Sec63 domain protein [Trachipleistophora hominis]
MKYEYDSTGLVTSYISLFFLTPVVIYTAYAQLFAKPPTKYDCTCTKCLSKREGRNRTFPLILCMLVGVMAYLTYNICTIRMDRRSDVFNPYEVLGLEEGASRRDIQRSFKRLSRLHDPDYFEGPNKHANEQLLKEISRAYNMLKSGKLVINKNEKHHEVIAIPSWLISNGYYSLAVYVLVFGVLFPFFAYLHWKRYTYRNKLGLYYETMEMIYRRMHGECTNTFIGMRALINVIADSKELQEHRYKRQIDMKAFIENNYAVPLRESKKITNGYNVLIDHLFRTGFAHPKDLEYVQKKALAILEGVKMVAFLTNNRAVLDNAFDLERMVVQAVPDPSFAAMQFPYITYNQVFLNKGKSVKELAMMIDKNERKVCMHVYDNLPRKIIRCKDAVVCEKKSVFNFRIELVDDVQNGVDKGNGLNNAERGGSLNNAERRTDNKNNGQNDNNNETTNEDNSQSINDLRTGVLVKQEGEFDYELLNAVGTYRHVPVHAPYFFSRAIVEWTLYALYDNELLPETKIRFSDFVGTKEVILDIPVKERSATLEIVLVCDRYFGCDVKRKVSVKVV